VTHFHSSTFHVSNLITNYPVHLTILPLSLGFFGIFKMHFSATILMSALAATPLVAAHGKVAAVQGDAGGNGTALGIIGGVVPGPGRNKVTEVDTTVFGKVNIATDGLGKTKGGGLNAPDGLAATMAQSGSTLPQVSANGGSINGVFHIVTTVCHSAILLGRELTNLCRMVLAQSAQ
jgi:hypothetical protein